MKLIDVLKKVQLFENINDKYLLRIIESSWASEKYFQEGEGIFLEKDHGEVFFIILTGSVRLYKTSASGREATVRILAKGESFAEIILFESNEYPVSSIALESTGVLAIHRNALLNLLEDRDFRIIFISNLMKKLRYLAKRVSYLINSDVRERLFLWLVEEYGVKDIFIINLSKKEIAALIGTIPETLSRLITKLKVEKVILKWDKGTLEIKQGFMQDFDI